ncbi:hypothetical protein AC1031_012037 [Aphanomyces cochlioides]|nr:hypothetical protein AC1031_012037 [Aphanomyces cochlioides]
MLEVECILAAVEMILGSVAPMIYASDTAIYSLTAQPVFAIPARFQSRYLSSATLRQILWGTTMLGTSVWDALKHILTSAQAALSPDEATNDATDLPETAMASATFNRWLEVMHAMEAAEESEALEVEPTKQVMFDTINRRLTFGDLSELWFDFSTIPHD